MDTSLEAFANRISGLDSQVVLGCLVRGRSSLPALNALLATSIGPLLGSGIYPYFMFFLVDGRAM